MPKEFNALKIASGGASQMLRVRAQEVRYGTKFIDQQAEPNKANIARSMKALKRRGLVRAQNANIESLSGEQMLALEVLGALGCSVSQADKDFSLLNQRDVSLLQNSRIDNNRALAAIRNSPVSAMRNFPNRYDPFYEPDPAMTLNRRRAYENRRQIRDSSNVVNLISDLTALNLDLIKNSPDKILKQYRDERWEPIR